MRMYGISSRRGVSKAEMEGVRRLDEEQEEGDKDRVPSLSEGSTRSSVDEVLRVKEEREREKHDEAGYGHGERRKGVLRKLRLHKV